MNVLRAAIEPTTLAFRANVITITPPRLPDFTGYTCSWSWSQCDGGDENGDI